MSSPRVLVLAVSAVFVVSVGALPASAQTPMDLSGSWQLNRQFSQFPKEVGFGTTFITGVPREAGTAGGGRRGGGQRGGGTGNRTIEPRAQNETAEDAARVRFLTDEVRNPYERLSITVTPASVTIDPDRVEPRTFRPGRKDEPVTLGLASGVATATWEGAQLVVAYKAETGRQVRYTYAINPGVRQLIVDVEFIERGGGDMVRRVYEPAPAVETQAAPTVSEPAASTASAPAGPLRLATQSLPASSGTPASPTGTIDQRPDAALRGLTRIGVVVEGLGSDSDKCGLKQNAIEAAVSKRLTDAGFRVERDADEDTYLYVNINTAMPSAGLCVSRYDVTLYSHTTGKLTHTSSPVLLQAELLHRSGLAGGAPAAHADGITKGITDSTEQFASQMRAANSSRP